MSGELPAWIYEQAEWHRREQEGICGVVDPNEDRSGREPLSEEEAAWAVAQAFAITARYHAEQEGRNIES